MGDKAIKINRADKHRARRLKPAKKVRKSKLLSKRTIIETVQTETDYDDATRCSVDASDGMEMLVMQEMQFEEESVSQEQ